MQCITLSREKAVTICVAVVHQQWEVWFQICQGHLCSHSGKHDPCRLHAFTQKSKQNSLRMVSSLMLS